jgi:predicted acetyltransferase
VAHLFASEGVIYGRFGYGLATRMGDGAIPKEHTAFAQRFEPRGTMRLVDHDEATRVFPQVYDEVRRASPGMFSRSESWWNTRRLADDPARRRGGPLNRALLELDGRAAGYALYRVTQDWAGGSSSGHVMVVEALATTAQATRELWRWLLDFDWTSEIRVHMLPLDHPLFLLLAEPRRMRFRVDDGQWVRLVDVERALGARTYAGDGEVVLDVADAFLPENAGRYRVSGHGCERTDAGPDIRLDVSALGSVYLGGFGFRELERASRLEQVNEGAVARADALFATGAEPWCAEIF